MHHRSHQHSTLQDPCTISVYLLYSLTLDSLSCTKVHSILDIIVLALADDDKYDANNDQTRNQLDVTNGVLLSASVERFGVSRMRDF